MADWIINLNWKFRTEIWKNCRKNGKAAIGWWNAKSVDEVDNKESYKLALANFRKIKAGDRVIAFLKKCQLGGWGMVTKPYNENEFEPQLAAETKKADFGRVVQVKWETKNTPTDGFVAQLKKSDFSGVDIRHTISKIQHDKFEYFKSLIKDTSKWVSFSEVLLSDEDKLKGAAYTIDFSRIKVGTVYDRPQLAKLWGYKSYEAISRGVVTPRNSKYIILFITKEKQAFLPQYKDALAGDSLEIDGENNHAADNRIVNSASAGDEIHLFYREKHHTPFIYYGQIFLASHQLKTDNPSHFVFSLTKPALISETSLITEGITHGLENFVADMEGKKKIRRHVSYERSKKNRKRALEIHGTKCLACGFDFDKFYKPQIAKNYIEIHHVESVTKQDGIIIDPAKDLIPLCSNCHSMAHREFGKILSLAEIQGIIINKGIWDRPIKK